MLKQYNGLYNIDYKIQVIQCNECHLERCLGGKCSSGACMGGGGQWGAPKSYTRLSLPLSVIKIEQYCSTRGGGALETLKSYEDNGAPTQSLRLLSVVGSGGVHCGVSKSYKR